MLQDIRDGDWIYINLVSLQQCWNQMKSANDPMYVEFIARLRAARKDKNITQSDLALALNRPQSYVSKVETCERRIDVVGTALWCSVLGIEIVSVLPCSLNQFK